MLVTVKRNEDGTVDGVHLYPETIAEVRELAMLVGQKVNLKSGTLFLNKQDELHNHAVKQLPKLESPDTNNEVYRHT
jgi:hypothetical protein